MPYDPAKHQRRSIRLRDYDYAQAGAYFITLCTHNRECLFGDIVDDVVRLSALGEIASEEWLKSAEIRREVELDAFVVMPNHVHGIVVIVQTEVETHRVGANGRPPLHGRAPLPHIPRENRVQRPAKSIPSFVAGYKSAVTKRINQSRNMPATPVWQRNYYERIIRHEHELFAIRKYIADNVLQWALDRENPSARKTS